MGNVLAQMGYGEAELRQNGEVTIAVQHTNEVNREAIRCQKIVRVASRWPEWPGT